MLDEVRPTFVGQYLNQFGTGGKVTVTTGAWNTEDHYGDDFTQWTGSPEQKNGWTRLRQVSDSFHAMIERQRNANPRNPEQVDYHLGEARWHLLRAETSCHFYWGDAWVGRAHEDLDVACAEMERAEHGF